MRTRLLLLMLVSTLGVACGGVLPKALASDPTIAVSAAPQADDDFGDVSDLPERDEIRKSVDLAPGSSVAVLSINGSVSIETSNGTTADVLVVRSAKTKDALQHRHVYVEATGGSLKIRGEEERGHTPDVRQRVVLKVPRDVSVEVSGVNGKVLIGEIDGTVNVNGVNGSVDVAHAASTSELSGINGRIRISLDRLASDGLHISGVNGKIELRFSEQVNAEISVTGINGNVFSENGNITVIGKMNPSSFRGRIGSGGPMIDVSGVNGNVELLSGGAR